MDRGYEIVGVREGRTHIAIERGGGETHTHIAIERDGNTMAGRASE